jgi:hypothetical protein
MSIVEFEVHLDQSENIELDSKDKEELKTVNKLLPFETKEVAKVILKQDWKLKTKFKLTMNIPEKDIQFRFIEGDMKKIQEQSEHARQVLSKIPIDVMSREDIEKQLSNLKIKFIDLDFLPNDNAMDNNRMEQSMRDILDYLVHWRRPEEFCLLENSEDEIKVFSFKDPEPNDIQQV